MDRRKFIKISGIGLAALGSGFGAKKFLERYRKPVESFSVFAFLPDDEEIIIGCLKQFRHKINNETFRHLIDGKNLVKIVNRQFSFTDDPNTFLTERYYDIKLIKLDQKVRGDIFISDDSKIVLDPDMDFENDLLKFRDVINKKPGSYLLSIELKEKDTLPRFKSAKNRFVKIENNYGLFDKISLSENYSSVIVPGNIGQTELMIKDGRIGIKNSSCRHKLCRVMAQFSGSNMIACVPNKVLITMA